MVTHPDIERANAALHRGEKARARKILVAFLEQQPKNAAGWYLLAQCVEKESETIFCLERVLILDPDHEGARQALSRLHRKPGHGKAGERKIEPPGSKNGPEEPDAAPQKVTRNWLLALGLVLVAMILFLAIAGPSLAPRDPLEEKNIFQFEGEWKIPPLNPLTPGYILGTDIFGRDLYSRLLWAVRPTMVMVSIVAAIRLLAGVVIGLFAGWFNGRPGRVLDSVIEIALSIPVLLVALGAIAVVGVELGIWAFIIGLSLTGWVETAQQVREQTRIVKGQVYVEAAHALGASNRQILVRHVLKQITPMLVMLFAFEVSSTLMATAGLGFLGYYIGGDVWVMVDDFVARRISGMPELGQMLATSWVTLTRPWTMVGVGTLIFTTVLGFNLIGEGLRQGLNLTVRRRGFAARLGEQAGMWIDEHIWHPAAQVANKPAVRTGLALAAFIIVFGAGGNQLMRMVDLSRLSGNGAAGPEDHPVLQATPTAAGQSPTPGPGGSGVVAASPAAPRPSYNPVIAWEIKDESGFDGGPVLAADEETLYALAKSGTLYALGLEGDILWQVELPQGGAGNPALDPGGDLYVADRSAGLNRVTPAGEVLWRFQSQAGDRSHSGPVLGPEGDVYYTVGTSSVGSVQAVSAEGEHLWATRAATPSFFQAPVVSATGEYIYLKEDIFLAETGERLELESEFRVNRFFTGEDGKDYLLTGGP
jgi:peptide/nickel transport system permease protein